MESLGLWRCFLETGAPEYYLLYKAAAKAENGNASENPGTGPAGSELQRGG